MLWLERPPFLRWAAAAVLVAVAAWAELAPPPMTEERFLAEDVPAGTRLEERHVESRPVPAGVLHTVEAGGVAAADLRAGDPLLASMVTEVSVPVGWALIEAPIPSHAPPGAEATAILVEEGAAPVEFPAIVVQAESADPFGGRTGTLAVPPDWIGAAAAAATEGRLLIGVTASGQ